MSSAIGVVKAKDEVKRPEEVNGIQVRMPQDYNFDCKAVKWGEYKTDYKLRTDAVWEKKQLKDWFRLTNRVFFFNRTTLKYQFTEPEDFYSSRLQPWGYEDEDIMDWFGYTRTGVTADFQSGIGPKQRIECTFNSFYSSPDYHKWWRCDQVYSEDRVLSFDRNPTTGLRNMKDENRYPCFREFYETSYACSDNIMKFLIELAYAKKAQDFFQGDVSNNEIRMSPTMFDSPRDDERITYTY